MPTSTKDTDALGSNMISIALIAPQESHRSRISSALAGLHGSTTREFDIYPSIDDLSKLIELNYDVIIIELDSDPEHALDLVENICRDCSGTVMVYSEHVFPEMLVRCMRAGAREFLTSPLTPNTIAEALVRAAVRRPARSPKKVDGKMFVFVGAKGGSGVTTVASNFAIALAEQEGSTLLIDLNLPLGDAAIDLGIDAQYSVANALESAGRLDSNFLSRLLARHPSGLSVLAGPDQYTDVEVTNDAVSKLLSIARQSFDYVVVDAGSRFGGAAKVLFQEGAAVYLITQVGVSELRNSNRLISELLKDSGAKVEVVLNRYAPRMTGIDEDSINKALTMRAGWKIPSDYSAVRNSRNTATPLAMKDSAITRVIQQMAKAATGAKPEPERKKRFGLFG
ncbi:MAG: AAA family ATPase [Acidobacteria bacterium]|nr:AAA family ATPase [Acidobacteriota bacterium]